MGVGLAFAQCYNQIFNKCADTSSLTKCRSDINGDFHIFPSKLQYCSILPMKIICIQFLERHNSGWQQGLMLRDFKLVVHPAKIARSVVNHTFRRYICICIRDFRWFDKEVPVDTSTIVAQILQSLEKKVHQTLSSISLDEASIQKLIETAIPEPEVRIEKVTETRTDSTRLHKSLVNIRKGQNQKQVINTLAHEIFQYARACSLIILGKQVSLWVGPGMGLDKGAVVGSLKHPFQIGSDSLIQRAIMERAAIASNNLTTTEETIYTTTGTSLPGCVACIPMTINGRVQGVVVADSAQQNFDDFALFSILTGVSTIAIEQLPFKEKNWFQQFYRFG
jgi:hypothetical protein